ncbi:F-box domain-containing protein [Apiospora kogelbergensis]|uniref:F-box domain-containing protein n=1 Tax=Apiospora kogelbergensis TaxID=1337665 RepID=A0AAW0RDL2_9PEZI
MESELENFREQWRAEVARSRNTATNSTSTTQQQQQQQQQRPQKVQAASSSRLPHRGRHEPPTNPKIASKIASHQHQEDDDDLTRGEAFDEPNGPVTVPNTLAAFEQGPGEVEKEPETALEFYEKAVDKETAGKLGDSLHLYRRAFRLDNHVEKAYRDKHFPGRWGKQPQQQHASTPEAAAATNPSNAPVTVPNTAHHSLDGPPLSLPDLIASFAGLSIQGAPPAVEGMPPPPSPMSQLPEEILVHILRDVAVLDIADFVRLSQVCKRFAFLVATEDRIWRRVSLGEEFGFGAMVYHFQRGISWEDLSRDDTPRTLEDAEDFLTLEELRQHQKAEAEATTLELVRSSLYASSWQNMWRRRPRIRFNGCYISTVNYFRQGQSTGNQITWNSPVHIVTYYRYLRFFRDGTVISLLTTADPADVVHSLTKELVRQHENKAMAYLPTAVMSEARKGRWRLSCPALDQQEGSGADPAEVEGDLFIETESSVGPKYEYRMDLALKSAGKGARNNKLAWKGFWSYNRLTDDWGTFELKNDKAYYFSRVKSYGFGGV